MGNALRSLKERAQIDSIEFIHSTMYTLYKNPIQPDTLDIVQYLASLGVNLQPSSIIERGHPPEVLPLPSIVDTEKMLLYRGLEGCVQFYEDQSGIQGILQKARLFKAKNPNYHTSCGNTGASNAAVRKDVSMAADSGKSGN